MVGPATPPKPPGGGLRTAGIALIVVGVLLGAGLVFRGFSQLTGQSPESVDGPVRIQVAAGETLALYRTGAGSEGSCAVVGPDGQSLSLEGILGTETLTLNGTSHVVVREVTAIRDGVHEVTCSGPGFAVGPRIGVFGLVGTVLSGVFGGLALIALGIVLLVIGISRRKSSSNGPPFPGQYPGQPPFPGRPPFPGQYPSPGQGQYPGEPPFPGPAPRQ